MKQHNLTDYTGINRNELGYDSWGRNKVIIDSSLFHGLFTFDVPPQMWIEEVDGVEQAGNINFTSVDGRLKIQGAVGESRGLSSKRHPRYQPNRGHLYSTAMILPDVALDVVQEFGLFTPQSGYFFRVRNGILYAVRRTMLSGVIGEVAEAITVPDGIDLTKGNIFDIQIQWRGVGNIKFFINLKLVHIMGVLGTLDTVTAWNPALPIAFNVEGLATMYCGCVDIASEGGSKENRQRGNIDTGELTLATSEIPVLLINVSKKLTYAGVEVENTRDIALREISAYADDATSIKVYYTRDATKFTGTVWADKDDLGAIRYSADGDITLVGGVADLKREATRRIPANSSIGIDNPDPDVGELYLTNGDYMLVTMQAKSSTIGGATMLWGAEI
jgi:hypothetical protein